MRTEEFASELSRIPARSWDSAKAHPATFEKGKTSFYEVYETFTVVGSARQNIKTFTTNVMRSDIARSRGGENRQWRRVHAGMNSCSDPTEPAGETNVPKVLP